MGQLKGTPDHSRRWEQNRGTGASPSLEFSQSQDEEGLFTLSGRWKMYQEFRGTPLPTLTPRTPLLTLQGPSMPSWWYPMW